MAARVAERRDGRCEVRVGGPACFVRGLAIEVADA
jgi:hypothetical protein